MIGIFGGDTMSNDFTHFPRRDAKEPSPWFLWEAIALGDDARRAASRDVNRVMQELGKANELDASGDVVRIEVTQEQVESLWLPLALAIQDLARANQQRVLVGVTGGAGTGKTIFSVLLCRVLHVLAGQEIAVPLGIDAYHFPNAFLDTQIEIEQGHEVPLRRFKGLPRTFDVEALVADLRRLRSSDEHEIRLPVYDRGRHDPVAGALGVRRIIASSSWRGFTCCGRSTAGRNSRLPRLLHAAGTAVRNLPPPRDVAEDRRWASAGRCARSFRARRPPDARGTA